MEPITLLQANEFERRLHATPSPATRHLSELRRHRAEARRERLLTSARRLRLVSPATVPQPCGC
jgi:hypothetical protein